MNVLTTNRIIQEGDEYKDNGKWKPVPKDDFGLQVMFSKYAEVRRPSEKPPKNVNGGEPTVPHPSIITPERFAPHQIEQMNKDLESAASYLPTVVSKKAHKRVPEQSSDNITHKSGVLYQGVPVEDLPQRETPETVRPTEAPKRAASPTPVKALPCDVTITYPDEAQSIWTGRNGTFRARAINLERAGDNIRIVPSGKRGRAANALIEFPASISKQVIAALESILTNTTI